MSQQNRDDEGRRPGPAIPPFRGPGSSRPTLRPSGRGAPRVAVTRLVLPPPKLTPLQNAAVATAAPVEPAPVAAGQTPGPPSLVRPATAPALAPVDEELSAISALEAAEPSSSPGDLPLLEEFIERPTAATPERHPTPPSLMPAAEPSPVAAERVPAIGATALHVAEALEHVAQRLRRGELTLSPHVVPSEEAALALAMAALLGARG